MKKLFRSGIALLLVLVTFAACGSKDSVPTVDQIKEDLIGQTLAADKIDSIEGLEIEDTENTKSTNGLLALTVLLEYTTVESYSYKKRVIVYYRWTDNKGWKYDFSSSQGSVE